jgi:hypothetical protein
MLGETTRHYFIKKAAFALTASFFIKSGKFQRISLLEPVRRPFRETGHHREKDI